VQLAFRAGAHKSQRLPLLRQGRWINAGILIELGLPLLPVSLGGAAACDHEQEDN
jgi:hypothetical protein